MDDQFVVNVYDTLCGVRIEQERVEGVENLFAPGSDCDRLYGQLWDAYERLLARLGRVDEDPDVEIILSSMLEIQRRVGQSMFFYGAKIGKE